MFKKMNIYFVKTPNTYMNALEYKFKYSIDDENYLIVIKLKKYGIKVDQLSEIIDKKLWTKVIIVNISDDRFRYWKGIKSIQNVPPIIKNLLFIKSLHRFKKNLMLNFDQLKITKLITSNDTLRDVGESTLKPKEVILIDRASSASRGDLISNQRRLKNQKKFYQFLSIKISPSIIVKPILFTSYPDFYTGYDGIVLANSYDYFKLYESNLNNEQKIVSILGAPRIEETINFVRFIEWVDFNQKSANSSLFYFPHPREEMTTEKKNLIQSKGIKFMEDALPIEFEYLYGKVKGCSYFISTHYTSAFTFLQEVSSNPKFIIISHEEEFNSEAVKTIGEIQYSKYKNDLRFKFIQIPNI